MAALTSSRSSALHIPAGKSIFARLLDMQALYRQRRALRSMDDARLRDLGLTRAAAEAEANRPLWDAPAHWSR